MVWENNLMQLGAVEKLMTFSPQRKLSGLMFNVANADGNLLCPCCGMTDQFSTTIYDARGGMIGSGICGACFWEPGFDDDPTASAEAAPTIIESLLNYRAKWIAEARPWRGTARLQPAQWNPAENLNHLLARAPHLSGEDSRDD
jgi:hypothetical protein